MWATRLLCQGCYGQREGSQYYLYSISAQQFAYPTDGEWTVSQEAVPVLLESQGDSHYCIKTKDGSSTFLIGEETHMTIVKSRDVTSEEATQLNTALGQLLSNGVSKLTAATQISAGVTSNHTDGWYALRIYSDDNHTDYKGNFLYTLATENMADIVEERRASEPKEEEYDVGW